MTSHLRVAAATFVLFAMPSLAAVACSKSDAPVQKDPIQIGFVPPPRPTASAASTATATEAPAPAFTSFFHDVDASSSSATAAAAPSAKPAAARAPDPDVAALEAVRSSANGCFSQAGLASGQTRSVSFTFQVLSTGRVARSEITGASSSDGAFYSCLQGVANSASFPEKADAGNDVRTLSITAQATAR